MIGICSDIKYSPGSVLSLNFHKMLLGVILVLGLSFLVNGRKFHKHERYHLYKKTHISGAHRSLVFDIPDHVNKGKKGCKHGGILRKHGEVWSPSPCIPECHCINGEVTCSKLECPDLNCAKTIKRKWKCCPECPPITERNGDKCGVRTTGGNANSSCCNFPFKYNGVLYYTCTYQHNNKPWCAVTANYDRDGVWGSCVDDSKSKKKLYPVDSKFHDDMTKHPATAKDTGATYAIPKILPSLTVNSVQQDHRPMPALDPSHFKQFANTPKKSAENILPFSAIQERISSIWRKIGFKKRVYNMLSKAGGQIVTVALPNGGFLPKAGQSYIIPSQYMRPQPIIPNGLNAVNAGNVNVGNANNVAAMSKVIISSYTTRIAPSSTTQVKMAQSQIESGQKVSGSSGQIIPSKVTLPQVSLTTPVISGQGPGSQVTTPQPTTPGQGNATQGTTAVPTSAPQGNGSQVTTPKPTGNETKQSDAVHSNAQFSLPNDVESSSKDSSGPSKMPANVTVLQNIKKQPNSDASFKLVAQQQAWSPSGGGINSTSQHGGMNVSASTQAFTPMPPYWSNVTSQQSFSNGSVGLPNIVPTTKPTPFVWPNITAPTTTNNVVWPNATAPTKPPFVWPNMTAPPANTTTAPPVLGQNSSSPSLQVVTLPLAIPVNTTASVVQGNTSPPQNGYKGAAGNNQSLAYVYSVPTASVNTSQPAQQVNVSNNQEAKSYSNSNTSSSSNTYSSPSSYSSSIPSSSSNTNNSLNTYSSSDPNNSSNTYRTTNQYSSSDQNSSSNTYSSSNPNSSSNTYSSLSQYSSSDPNSSSNTYSSSNPNSSSNTYSSLSQYSRSDPNSSSNTYSSSNPNSSYNTYSSSSQYSTSSNYSDPYQQHQQDQPTNEKAKQSEDSNKTKEKEETKEDKKKEDDPSAHLYEYMTMQPPSEPLVPDPYEAQRRAAQQARELAEAYNKYLKNFYVSHGYGA